MRDLNCKKHVLSLVIGALCTTTGIASQAQSLTLEEVIVTAQKRAQSLQDVPIAVSALNSSSMADAGIQTMEDVSRHIPSLEVQTATSTVSTSFRLRRVGNLGNIPSFEPAVGVFIDGAFRSRSFFGTGELFDLDRMEILRGPQSTLYGKNTTAGVIGIYTAAPSDEFTASGELSAGNIEGADDATSVNFKGGISGPLTNTLAGSLGVSYANHEETMDQALSNGGEDANENDRYSLRGQLRWDASEALELRAIVGTVQQDEAKTLSEDIFYEPGGVVAGVILPSFQAAGVSDTCSDNDPSNRTSCLRKSTTSDIDAWEGTLLASYALDNGWTVNSISSWDYYKFEGTKDDVAQVAAPVLRFHDTQENESWQQELRLTSAGGETIDWMGGVFYYTNEFKRGDEGDRPIFLYDTLSDAPVVAALNQALLGTPFPLPFATQGQMGYLDAKQDTDYLGIFGQAAWNITDSVTVTAGLRWQKEEKDASVLQSLNDPSPSIISLLLSPAAVSGDNLDRDTDEVTWSVTPQWFVTEDTMLYATVAHGFKSGGFNVGFGRLPIAEREFKDEDIMHYEAGVKTELWDGRMRLSGNAFYTEFDDYQDAAFIGAQFTVGNADKVELKGVELEGTVLLTEKLTADFAVSYADLTYDKNLTGACYPGRTSDGAGPGTCDLSGDHPINAPEWKTHLGIMYEQPLNWGDIYARADWSWTDEYNTSFSSDPLLTQDSYSWVSLRTGARWDNYELVLWVDNATDEEVSNIDAVLNIYAADNSHQRFLQAPRSYGLTFRANY
jgi:iron complex outermembrane receptor protein